MTDYPDEQKTLKPRANMFRFRLKSLLLVTVAAAIVFAVWASAKNRSSTVHFLRENGCYITFQDKPALPFYTNSMVWLFGDDAVCPVDSLTVVELSEARVVNQIAKLIELKHLSIEHNSDPLDLSPLRSLGKLETLSGCEGWIGDTSFVSSLKSLKSISMTETQFGGDLSELGSLPRLKSLQISLADLKLTNDSFRQLCNATSLRKLDLTYNYSLGAVDDFSPVTNLKLLRELHGVLDPQNTKDSKLIELLPDDCEVKFSK